ncbi:hypothetical protein CLV59_101997 [Chitinophaga dinghuensis]|uniref:Lipoprotein n=2 Tax=Chitinophaga dinghuensis TaxID=1539050 RepID=A0A327WDA6_9BACT|nr:hypothetical protein CLV59_101997 [Chitinophaga dinghuensis]
MSLKLFSSNNLLLLSCALLVTSCNIAGECNSEITARISNPNKTIQAILEETDCGATTSTSYGICLVEGSLPTVGYKPENTILGSRRYPRMQWKTNDTLCIHGADTTNGYTMKTHLLLKNLNKEVTIIYTN